MKEFGFSLRRYLYRVILILFLTISGSVNAQSWIDVKHLTPEEIAINFLSSVSEYKSRKGLDDYKVHSKIVNDAGVIYVKVFISPENYLKIESKITKKLNLYSIILGKELNISINNDDMRESKEIVNIYFSNRKNVFDVLKEYEDSGRDFGRYEGDLCARSALYNVNGFIEEVFSTVNMSLNDGGLNKCINNVLFHSFYFGDVSYYGDDNIDKKESSLTGEDILNMRILYDDRIPLSIGESSDVSIVIPVARDAKKWFCLAVGQNDC